MKPATFALRALRAQPAARQAAAFSSSARMAFAQPAEEATPAAGKKPQMKEFKIYRWVCPVLHCPRYRSEGRERYGI
jgi:hypothetical protein